ncbi:MAG TPA: SH3 domain-containing protein [Turneriella sp.]|nr:SH3 domain-containing protein [Turneriella sp.]
MPVVTHPTKQNLGRRVALGVFTIALTGASVTFLYYRFSDTPVEKVEKLFLKRHLTELRDFSRKQLEKGNTNPVLYSYYAVGEFSTNPKSQLSSILSNIKAVDERPIFRREALTRILQIPSNYARAGEILTALVDFEENNDDAIKDLIARLVDGEAVLESRASNFIFLKETFPKRVKQVAAKELQWRTHPSTESDVIRRLEDGEELFVRKTEAGTIVSGKKGHWAYVLDSAMQSGWVFNAYLK